jgi:hypothetical protein
MMETIRRSSALVLMMSGLLPLAAAAQNTTVSTALAIGIGQEPVWLTLPDGTSPARWYTADVSQGRSYCVETGLAPSSNYWMADTRLTIFAADGSTQLGTNDQADTEPALTRGSRVCWISPGHGWFFAKVEGSGAQGPSVVRNVTLRAVETTMWSPWFFQAGDYNAFVLMRNTTELPVNFTVTWHNAAGVQVGTYSGTAAAHAGVALNSRVYVSNPETNSAGTVDVAHDGSPEALVGQVTTISGSTGINFDSPFHQRRPW